ncbi:uncharacterized protein C8A04DRAFT_39139 [Dichotomopilus funicola]|uniref:ER transporter 6TM N-terminal domain-containing protein n=1 Tax=Dichotomopilus funicola TaxID=1934379 RepID=A0AAN6ZKQ1_9PEZI|nr:hypothetical protein C8A04DRAFT_39139 [Dichotomopilus funicola]
MATTGQGPPDPGRGRSQGSPVTTTTTPNIYQEKEDATPRRDDERGEANEATDDVKRTATTRSDRRGSAVDAPGEEKKPNWFKGVAAKLGLDVPTVATMFKGSLPPTIAIAMLQSRPVALYFSTLGYLIPVISVIAMAIMPRGKFLMNLLLNAIAVCVGSAVSMLALWSAVQARQNTAQPGALPTAYNSSQSAVCAIWLFANIWFGNVVRAKLPAFNLPIITYSILVNVAATFGPIMTTVPAARLFVQQLMTAMLAALAIATGVNLFIFPVSSRLVLFKELAGGVGLLRQLIAQQKVYLASLEPDATFNAAMQTETFQAKGDGEENEEGEEKPSKEREAAKVLEETGAKLRELAGKMHADLPFAKRDIAWGKLDAKDLSEMYKLFRNVYIPVFGMNTIIDIFQRFSARPEWESTDDANDSKDIERHVWNEVMKQVQEPLDILAEAVDQGLEHAAMCLELLKRPKKLTAKGATQESSNPPDIDLEAAEEPKPGDPEFARVLDDKIQVFYSRKGELLRKWVQERGVLFDDHTAENPHFNSERDQVQLYIILYMENLMHASGEAVQDLVDFADEKVEDGTMAKKRFIAPTVHRLRKWLQAVFGHEDSSPDQTPDVLETGANLVHFGNEYNRKKNPERLPPETAWERFGDGLRKIPKFFGSEESAFGFRVACATMTIGIVAFLEETQRFFIEQRLVWAMIIIAIGTSGQSIFGLLCRIGGTVAAMCFALVIWYIVDEKSAGVIVFLWISVFINYYFFIKFPRFLPAVLICVITQVLIIGYELQVRTIGLAAAQRTGQPYYPSTLRSNVHRTAGDVNVPGTPGYQLYKVGRKIFGKVMMLIPSMSQHSEWQKWEPTIGGKFPRAAYDDIIMRSTRILAYLTLTSYTLMHPTHVRLNHDGDGDGDDVPGSKSQRQQRRRPQLRGASLSLHTRSRAPSVSSTHREWLDALSEVLDVLKPTHHTILSALTLLSNALLSGQSLPPFLPLPRPYEMTRQLMRIHRDAFEPGGEDQMRRYSDAGVLLEEREGDYDAIDENDDHSDDDIADGGPIRMVDSRTGRDDYLPGGGTTRRRRGSALPSRQRQRSATRPARPAPMRRRVTTRRDQAVADILDPRNMEQPGYAEFAVLQICTTLVCDDLEGLVRAVSGLVGVVDFSFKVGGESDSSLDLGKAGEKGRGKKKAL